MITSKLKVSINVSLELRSYIWNCAQWQNENRKYLYCYQGSERFVLNLKCLSVPWNCYNTV